MRPWVVGAVVATLLFSGCAHWTRSSLAPQDTVAVQPQTRIRLFLRTGQTVVVQNASVARDTLVGTLESIDPPDAFPKAHPGRRVAVPLTNVESVEVRRGNTIATIGLTLGLVMLGFGVILGIAALQGDLVLGD